MSTVKDWLERLKNRPAPANAWEAHRRSEALELLAQAQGRGNWIELSRHPNGFIREMAVRELCRHPSPDALVALVERLNDWVAQIRSLATEGMQHYLTPEHVPDLLGALGPLIALIAQRRADHGPVLMALRSVLQAPQVRADVQAHFLTCQSKTARYLFTLLLESDPAPQTLLRSALAHRELTVRLLAIAACQALPPDPARALLLEALSRPGAKIRVTVLRALLPLFDDPQPLLRQTLLDASPAIRNLARWTAKRDGLNVRAVLDRRLDQPLPVSKTQWLGVLGLTAELDGTLPPDWLNQAQRSPCSSVRHAAVRLLRDDHVDGLLQTLDDPADKVFFAVIARLDEQPWTVLQAALDARLDQGWHVLPVARREALWRLRPAWQRVAYLLERLEKEPVMQAFWLRQIDQWCHRQYQVVDPVTSRKERAALIDRLKALAAQGLLRSDNVSRVVG